MSIIELDRVGKRFGDEVAIRDLSFGVEAAQIVALIGPSGCGKTTTVRCITGAYEPDDGAVRTLGHRSTELSMSTRQRIGYLPQRPVLFDSLTLWENLQFHASLNGVGLRRRRRLHELLELVELAGEEKKLVREASGGMQRRLALAATLLHRPDLVLLDEPTAGIDPILRARFWDHFRTLAGDHGTTFLVTTQYVGEAAHCDRVGLLSDGELLHYSTPEDLRREAIGGEQFRVETSRRLTDDELASAASLAEVGAPLRRIGLHGISGVVEDAGAAIPALTAWLTAHDVAIVESEEVVVSYDDAFVALVERHRDEDAPPAATSRHDVVRSP